MYDSPARIRALTAMSHEALAAEVRRHFPARLGGFTVTGRGASAGTPPRQRLLRRSVVLLGDAAHTINPLAGRGEPRLQDVACWTELLGKAGPSGMHRRWRRATSGGAARTTC